MKQLNEVIVGRDYKQEVLCVNCWDGAHYYKYEISNVVGKTEPFKRIVHSGAGAFSNCLEGSCECHCRELVADRAELGRRSRELVKREKEAQMSILDAAE